MKRIPPAVLAVLILAVSVHADHDDKKNDDPCAYFGDRFYRHRADYEKRYAHHDRDVLEPLRRKVREEEKGLGDLEQTVKRIDRLRKEIDGRKRANANDLERIEGSKSRNRTASAKVESEETEAAALKGKADAAEKSGDEKEARRLRRRASELEAKARKRRKNNREREQFQARTTAAVDDRKKKSTTDEKEIARLETMMKKAKQSTKLRRIERMKQRLQREIDRAAEARKDLDFSRRSYEMCRDHERLRRENRELREENRRLRERLGN
ncbi:MAG: hypothetical protein CMJ18_12395 [Phycisphaeraceae bacterium]|nr:hypothetical protein [Phycisphaeraceae bacterium]